MISRVSVCFCDLCISLFNEKYLSLPKIYCNMKKILSLLALGALCFASCDNTPKFHVEGSITEAQDSMLYLEAVTLDGLKSVDSVKLAADGKFSLKGDAPQLCPEFYILRIGSKHINFSIDSTETVTFTASLPTMTTDYTVSGSENCEKIKEIYALQQKTQNQLIAVEDNEDLLPGDMIDSIKSIIESYKETIRTDYIFKDPGSAYAYYAVCQSLIDRQGAFQLFNPVSDRKDVKVYATVATAWDAKYHDAPRTEQLCNTAIKGMDNTATPQQKVIELADDKISETGIIGINLPDINSKLHDITELKGKVVMLDFTIFSAKESPARTRQLRELYNKYHDRGFEIYQISLDEDTHYWKTAVEHLPWICVHETDGSVTTTYGIQNLPTYFIINRNNEIVGRSDFLETTIEEEILKLL